MRKMLVCGQLTITGSPGIVKLAELDEMGNAVEDHPQGERHKRHQDENKVSGLLPC
jgi:hypothetical protein